VQPPSFFKKEPPGQRRSAGSSRRTGTLSARTECRLIRNDVAPDYDEATMTESLKAAVLLDRTIVAVSGPDRVKFLQGLMTNDIRRLAPDKALYAGFLTGQGKLICDAFVLMDGDRILIDIALVEDFVKRLTAFKLRATVEIGETAPALAVTAVWGPGAMEFVQYNRGVAISVIWSRRIGRECCCCGDHHRR